jgi:hypothetical protein
MREISVMLNDWTDNFHDSASKIRHKLHSTGTGLQSLGWILFKILLKEDGFFQQIIGGFGNSSDPVKSD